MIRPVLLVVLVPLLASGAPKKKPAPAPPAPAPAPAPVTCAELQACLDAAGQAFGAADFETAAQLSRQAEALVKTDLERAQVLVLQAALSFHSVSPRTPGEDARVSSLFEQALKLAPELTVLAIPPYARSRALEALWAEAQARRPKPVPAAAPAPVLEPRAPPPAGTVVTDAPAPRRFPMVSAVLLGVGIVSAGLGVGFRVSAEDLAGRRSEARLDRDNWRDTENARWQATASTVSFAVAGGMALLALVTWLVLR